jgi:nucleoside-diphosphate-sugar epimerase
MTEKRLPVLIVGSTGDLGALITKHCLQSKKLQVNALLQDPDQNQDLVQQIEKQGGKVYKGDVLQPETLIEPTKNIHTVISALSGFEEKVAVDGQINLAEASIHNGVKRLVPSDFGMNYSKFSPEEIDKFLAAKHSVRVKNHLEDKAINLLSFWPGTLMERFFEHQEKGFCFWGEADHKLHLTAMEDLARVVAASVENPDLEGRIVFVGNEVTIRDVSDTYHKVRGGKKMPPKRLGSMKFLNELHDKNDNTDDPKINKLLGFSTILFDDRSTFDGHDNQNFPHIKPTSIEDFLKQNEHIKVGDPCNKSKIE